MAMKSCTLYSTVFHIIIACMHAVNSHAWQDRAKQLCSAGEVCDPAEGSWMPLPEGVKCGVVDCDWPSQWCTVNKGRIAGVLDIKCTDVPKNCPLYVGKPDPVQKDSVLVDQQPTPITSAPLSNHMPSLAPPASCIDRHEMCCYWAAKGECDKNAYFMKMACQKSCGTCGCTVETAQSCAVNVNIGECKWLSAVDQSNASPQPNNLPPPQPIYPQPPQPQPNYQPPQPTYQQPQPNYQPPQPAYQQPQSNYQQQRQPCQPRPNCQVGIFPSAGGGCGAKQYGGREGCGQDDGWRPFPPLPKPRPSQHEQPPAAHGPPPHPTLPLFNVQSGQGSGCGDISNTCQSMPTNRCQNSQLINNVVCPQACGQCKGRKK